MWKIFWRGARGRCPRCGRGRIFAGWNNVRTHCHACGLRLRVREPDTWMFMYVSAAFITGLFVIGLLWKFPVPTNKWLWRGIMGCAALALFFGTSPLRKGLALGLDYLMDVRGEPE
jgi:uncharacterized protein (DUF983 family)